MHFSPRGRAGLVAATAAGLALTMAGSAVANPRTPAGGGHGSQAFDHIYVIMLENHSQSSVIDDPNAPFITRLAHTYAMADHYYGVTHPSMPNYIATIAGDNFGIQDDEDENVVNLDRENLVDQLEAAHVTWGAYMETLPPDKQARYWPRRSDGSEIKLYARKHNPFVLFDDITGSSARMDRVRDYSRLAHDLNAPHAPQFVWISPNQCNDMHGGVYDTVAGHPETPCPYGSAKDDPADASLKQKADQFVEQAVRTITHSRAWTSRSAIVIVTDENDYTANAETGGWENADGCCDSPYVPANDPRLALDADTASQWPGGTYGGGLIPAIVVTGAGPRHLVDHTPYNHYSLLTTIEDNWNLGHIGHAGDTHGGVVPMWRAFTARH